VSIAGDFYRFDPAPEKLLTDSPWEFSAAVSQRLSAAATGELLRQVRS
jgi:hypothetical protein